jgi:hypothetical protein
LWFVVDIVTKIKTVSDEKSRNLSYEARLDPRLGRALRSLFCACDSANFKGIIFKFLCVKSVRELSVEVLAQRTQRKGTRREYRESQGDA